MGPWLDEFLHAARSVARDADALVPKLGRRSTDLVVNVHAYAFSAHEAFLRRYYADGRGRVVALSMNPARNGAVQSGIAFTDAPTARTLLPDFDRLVRRPAEIETERPEMSGQKLRAWAERDWDGLDGLYQRILFPIACPVAILRKPSLLNVPLATLQGPPRQAADAFYQAHAPLLVRAARPRGILLLGEYAARQWARVAAAEGDLQRIPAVVTHHPAARMSNEKKFNDWTASLGSLWGSRGSPTP